MSSVHAAREFANKRERAPFTPGGQQAAVTQIGVDG
jgi:hypothetical protein